MAAGKDRVVLVLLAGHAHHLHAPILVLHDLVFLVSHTGLKHFASSSCEVFATTVVDELVQLLGLGTELRNLLLIVLELGVQMVKFVGKMLFILTQLMNFLRFLFTFTLQLAKLFLQVFRNFLQTLPLLLLLLASFFLGLLSEFHLSELVLFGLDVPLHRLDLDVGVQP